MKLLQSKPPMPTLTEDRVLALQAEINSYIDARAAELKATDAPLVPLGVLRNILTSRSGGCECRAYLRILEHDEGSKQ
jgi:hypothetical protein